MYNQIVTNISKTKLKLVVHDFNYEGKTEFKSIIRNISIQYFKVSYISTVRSVKLVSVFN